MADRRPAVEGETCCARVRGPGRFGWVNTTVCENRARIVEDGHAYCGTHDPQKRRDLNAKRNERWAAEDAARDAEATRLAAERALVRAALAWRDAENDGGDSDSAFTTMCNAIEAAKAAGVTG